MSLRGGATRQAPLELDSIKRFFSGIGGHHSSRSELRQMRSEGLSSFEGLNSFIMFSSGSLSAHSAPCFLAWASPHARGTCCWYPYLPFSSPSGPSGQLRSQEGGGGGRASGQLKEGICTGLPRSFPLPPLAPEESRLGAHQVHAGKRQR